jgi:hypothetical protein
MMAAAEGHDLGHGQLALHARAAAAARADAAARRALVPVHLLARAVGRGHAGHHDLAGAALEVARQIHAFEPLHDQVGHAVGGAAVGDVADHARVLDLGQHRGLLQEAIERVLAVLGQILEGHDVAGLAIAGAIDAAHAARGHGALDLEAARDDVSG